MPKTKFFFKKMWLIEQSIFSASNLLLFAALIRAFSQQYNYFITKWNLFRDRSNGLVTKSHYYDCDTTSLKKNILYKNIRIIDSFCDEDKKRLIIRKLDNHDCICNKKDMDVRIIIDYSNCQKLPHLQEKEINFNNSLIWFIDDLLIFNYIK